MANLLARHFAFILHLIALQTLSFCKGELTGNLLKTKTFKEFSLEASRQFLLCVPSVLLLIEEVREQLKRTSVTFVCFTQCPLDSSYFRRCNTGPDQFSRPQCLTR